MIYGSLEEEIRRQRDFLWKVNYQNAEDPETRKELLTKIETLDNVLLKIEGFRIPTQFTGHEFSDLVDSLTNNISKLALKKIEDFFDQNPMRLFEREEVTKTKVRYVFIINKITGQAKKIDLVEYLQPTEDEMIIILQENKKEEEGS